MTMTWISCGATLAVHPCTQISVRLYLPFGLESNIYMLMNMQLTSGITMRQRKAGKYSRMRDVELTTPTSMCVSLLLS